MRLHKSVQASESLKAQNTNLTDDGVATVRKRKQRFGRTQARAIGAAILEDSSTNDVYVPENDIPDEVLSLIAAWESSNLTFSRMDSSVSSAPAVICMLEPAACAHFKPPKRFFRTFWRSISRRILALSSTQ